MDTVRIPLSLVPYEDLSARHQKQLKTQQQAGPDVSESAVVEQGVVKASEALASAEEMAASKQTSEDTTASDGPRKD